MICSSCLLIEFLDIRSNRLITIEGLNNVHCLKHLKTFYIIVQSDHWLSKLSNYTALTDVDLSNSNISNEGLSHLSSLDKLSRLVLKRCWEIDHNLVLNNFAFPISIFTEDEEDDEDD
jgi:hypothetical protein